MRNTLKHNIPLWVCVMLTGMALPGFTKLQNRTASEKLSYKYTPGDVLIYQIEYKNSSDADFRVLFEQRDSTQTEAQVAQTGMTQSHRITVSGEFVTTVLATEGDIMLLSYRLMKPGVKLEINGTDGPLQAEIVAGSLRLDIFSEVTVRGRILSVSFDPDVEALTKNFAKAILAKTQFVFAGESYPGKEAWETREEAPNGTLTARYEPVSQLRLLKPQTIQPDQKAFRKSKIKYLPKELQKPSSQSQLQSDIRPEGSVEALFNFTEGYLEKLSGSETEQIFITNKKVAHVESSILLTFLRKEKLPISEIEIMKQASEVRKTTVAPTSLSVTISKERSESIIQRGALGEDTLASLLTELAEAEAAGQERNTQLYLKFKALVFLHPETCYALGDILAKSAPGSLTQSIISGALSVIGHPRAQAALIAAIKSHPDDIDFQLSLLQSLCMVESPTKQTEAFLRSFIVESKDENVYSAVILGLGQMAKSMAGLDSARSDALVDWIVNQISPTTSESRLRLVLMALGNSGSIRALATIKNYLNHDSFDIRVTAVTGLRWINSEEADRLLAQVLQSDPDNYVRSETAFALSFRKPSSVTLIAQKKALLEDDSEMVRLSVLRNISEMVQVFPEALQLIKKAAESDPAKEVRKAATEILEKFQ